MARVMLAAGAVVRVVIGQVRDAVVATAGRP